MIRGEKEDKEDKERIGNFFSVTFQPILFVDGSNLFYSQPIIGPSLAINIVRRILRGNISIGSGYLVPNYSYVSDTTNIVVRLTFQGIVKINFHVVSFFVRKDRY